jgi:serine/threonine-protein kinase
MTNSSDDRDPVERLAEEFLERRRRGESPALTEYVDRHPEWAEEIRAVFPALVMMEQLKPASGDVTGSFVGDGRADPSRVPERLADFRILREVGRGGMGIVFEAEQESLGRHVALKVLPSHALLNPRHLQRFLREARSAARLHHTNIVPVFGVGESDGLHYYVMQFITGSALSEVIDELRRLKAVGRPDAGSDGSPLHPTRSLHAVTRGLLTGQFAATPTGEATDPGAQVGSSLSTPAQPSAPNMSSGSSILSGAGRGFAKAVARVGLQVAEALEYAHGQGVLHRDIKPSNLLLDVQGTVWVTDFGLAKASADSDNLTHEGDVLGTLRYMAPERFRGKSDARSDVYALGLTLYEVLTLRPAFDQDDRDRLILQVTNEVPPHPRSLNPEIPRDLETIVLKAIEHDPARRYEDAEELAADLERFLADRPIKARPVGALERAWKWAQRKPAIAGLLAALAVALVIGFAGITWQWRLAVAARNDARKSTANAEANFAQALETVNTFCTQVSEEQLLDEPGMQPLRRRLLELARQYYQRFQRQQGDNPDPRLMKDLALTFMRSGIIANELGDGAGAQVALLRARDILEELRRVEELRASHPRDVALRVQLARCHIEIENADRVNDYAQAVRLARNALDAKQHPSVSVLEPLLDADPQNLEYLRLLGRAYDVAGVRTLRSVRYRSAEDSLRKSVATLERVCRAATDDVEAARWLALACADLGLVYQEMGHPTERRGALEKAQAIFEAIEKRSPGSRRNRLERSECLVNLGAAHIDVGRFHNARTLLSEADARLSRLVQEDPSAVASRYWLAVARQGLGHVALARGQKTAVALLQESIAMYEHVPAASQAPRDLLARAWSLLWLGRAELQRGHPEAVLPLHGRLVELLDAQMADLNSGISAFMQIPSVLQVGELRDPLLACARATTAGERITAQRREVQARESLAQKQPDNPALRFEVAWSLVQFAELLINNGQVDEAASSLDRARPVLEELTKAEPENLRWLQGLARAWETHARVQTRSGHKAEAEAAAARAVAIAEDLARKDTAYLYDLACILSLASSLASSESNARAAITALRRAKEAGFDNEYLLRTDPRLTGLRSRPDFPAQIGAPRRST